MRHEVTNTDTAAALGSGDVPVLATPRLIAWMEAATVRTAAAYLGTGQDDGRHRDPDGTPSRDTGGRQRRDHCHTAARRPHPPVGPSTYR